MFEMKIDSLIERVVRHELLSKCTANEAMYFNFDISLSVYKGDSSSYTERRGLHLLYHSPYGASINVFSSVTENCFASLKDVGNRWKHETSHDSCWKDIRVFSKTYFEMAESINSHLRIHGQAEKAPKDMDQFNCFRDYLFRWVSVKVSKDPKDTNNYRRIVEIL